MRPHGGLDSNEDSGEAAYQATLGAINGAAKWGLISASLGAAGFALSPIYRGLTIQFKVFLQMSGMTVGSMMEADRRLREYESRVRLERKFKKDQAVWKKWENEIERSGSLQNSK